LKQKPQIPDTAAKLPARVVAQRPYSESTEQIVCIQHHWYFMVWIKSGDTTKVRDCNTIDLEEARRLLLQWGFSPAEVYGLTYTVIE
jgi:hypothetical protein